MVTRRVSEGELSCRFFLAHASGYHLHFLGVFWKPARKREIE